MSDDIGSADFLMQSFFRRVDDNTIALRDGKNIEGITGDFGIDPSQQPLSAPDGILRILGGENEDGVGEAVIELAGMHGGSITIEYGPESAGAFRFGVLGDGEVYEGGVAYIADYMHGRVVLTSDEDAIHLHPDFFGTDPNTVAEGDHTHGSAEHTHASIGGGLGTPDYMILNEAGTYSAVDRNGTVVSTGTVLVDVVDDVKGSDRWIMFGPGEFDLEGEHVQMTDLENLVYSGCGMGVTHIFNETDDADDTEPLTYTNCQRMVVRDMDISAGGSVRTSSDCLDFDGGNDHLIERVRVLDSRGRGIVFDGKDLGRTANNCIVRDCVVTGCRGGNSQAGSGVVFLGAPEGQVVNCHIYGNTGTGITSLKAGPAAVQPNKTSDGMRVTNCLIYDNGNSGVVINSAKGCQIIGNRIYNNSQAIAWNRDGVEITVVDSVNPDGNIVVGNYIFDDQGSPTQDYGVSIAAGATNTVVMGNVFWGHHHDGVNDLGTGTVQFTTLAQLSSDMLSSGVTVPDEAYGPSWNSNLQVPTKNAVYDKIQTIFADGGTELLTFTIGPFHQPTVSATATDAEMLLSSLTTPSTTTSGLISATSTTENVFRMPHDGSIVVGFLSVDDPRTAGTAILRVRVNDSYYSFATDGVIIDASNTLRNSAVDIGGVAFVGGDYVGAGLTTSSYGPGTGNFLAYLVVRFNS